MLEKQFARSGGARSLYRACLLRGMRARQPNTENPWPEDHVIDMVLRAAQSPTSMANTPDLAMVMAEFAEALVPYSAAAALFGMSQNLTFGSAGILSVLAVSDLPLADWIAEGAPMPVVMGLASAVAVTPFKLGAIVALSNEMMLSSSAETMMRAALLNNIGPSLDASLFTNAAGVPGLRPPGLLNGVAITPPSAPPTSPSEMMIEDVENLVDALAAYGGNGRIALIASPKQSVRLTKFIVGEKGYPVFIAANLTNTLIAVATRGLAVSMDPPAIDTSSQAVMHMEDTTPLPIVDDAGVMAAPVRSMWQTDSVGLRFRLPVSWALLAPAVAWTTPAW